MVITLSFCERGVCVGREGERLTEREREGERESERRADEGSKK